MSISYLDYSIKGNENNMVYKISQNGENILKKYENNIIFSVEILEHDGYDQYGPESNLWTLYIVIKENNDFILYRYYFEDWYEKKDLSNFNIENDSYYYFELKTNIKDIEFYDLYRLKSFLNKISNNELLYILNL
jgi:hypothetical protein